MGRCECAGISRQKREHVLRQEVGTDGIEESGLRVTWHRSQEERCLVEDVSNLGGNALECCGPFATYTGQADLAARSDRGNRACLRRMFPEAHPVPFKRKFRRNCECSVATAKYPNSLTSHCLAPYVVGISSAESHDHTVLRLDVPSSVAHVSQQ